jgi:nucleotidyltransferase substrate binding protein (TIGR01987 family)
MLDLTSLKKATNSLRIALKVASKYAEMKEKDIDTRDTLRAGVIQNFEFTYELCWKFMKRWLENELGSASVDGLARKQLFRLAAEHHLINDVENWMEYHEQRNETSHAYDATTAEEIYESAQKFIFDAEKLLAALEQHNA